MQSLLLPAGLSSAATVGATPSLLHFRSRRQLCAPALSSPKLSSSFQFLSNSPLSYDPLRSKDFKFPFLVKIAASPASTAYTSPPTDESERAKLAQVQFPLSFVGND
ncbi:hypothetical protein LINPERHAP2_LOCUS6716 [Linum perenne]